MLIENGFTVAASPDTVWAHLLDVEKVAPCMPGAELTETVDDRNWKGKVLIAFGPVKMSFAGTVTLDDLDDEGRRVRLHAKGTEQKGKGAASAKVTSWLEPTGDGGTQVSMEADIALTGAAAQLSRGLLPEISQKLTQRFADCLQANLTAGAGIAAVEEPDLTAPEGPTTTVAKPVGGVRLALSALWARIVGVVRRLFGSKG